MNTLADVDFSSFRFLHFRQMILSLLFLPFPNISLHAQAPSTLFAAATISKGYVVGAKLNPSGLHRWQGDTTWQLIGWKHPRVSGITFARGGVILLACGNGVLKSADDGHTWKFTTDWRVTEAQAIITDPHDPKRFFLATAFGLWRSTDTGETWHPCDSGLRKKFFSTIKPDRQTAGRLLVGGEGGIYFSEDTGESWRATDLQDIAVLDLEQSPRRPDFWLAGSEGHGVFLSTDNGRTWHRASGSIAEKSIYSVSIAPTNPELLLAAGWDSGVFLSRDAGKSWQQIGADLPTRHFYQVAFAPGRPNRIWAATVEEGIFFSDDFGASWRFSGLYGAIVFDLYFHSGEAE